MIYYVLDYIYILKPQYYFTLKFTIDNYELDFILLNIGYAEHFADWNWKNVNSPFVRLHYVTKGNAKIMFKDETFEMKQNHIYLTPSYTQHSYFCDGEFCVYYIHLYEKPENTYSIFEKFSFPFEIKTDELLHKLIQRLHTLNPGRELSKYDPSLYDNTQELIKNISIDYGNSVATKFESQAIINLILSRFVHLAKVKIETRDERITHVLNYIHTHIEKSITLEELANQAHVSKDHLIRMFKNQLGCTPIRYINQKKIEKAQLLILVNKRSLKNVAYSLGFDNMPYFNRLFKQTTGETPSAYRKKQ